MRYLLPAMAAIFTAATANAHIVASPDAGVAGTYFQTSLRIAHGCEGSPTTELHVKIPANVITVHPQHKQGWNVTIVRRKLDQPMPLGHGKMTEEAVREIIWRGKLPSDQYDDFGLLMKLPVEPDQTLWFPVAQICAKGRTDWAEIPAEGEQWHSLHAPAPFVRVIAASAQ